MRQIFAKTQYWQYGNKVNVNLSPFLNHWQPKISNDSLVPVDGLVDRRFLFPRYWKGERMPQHRFPPPVFLGDSFLRHWRSDFKPNLAGLAPCDSGARYTSAGVA